MESTTEARTNYWLDTFERTLVDLPGRCRSDLATALKTMPRAGKALRFDYYSLDLPKRSVYDHVRSLGVQADLFFAITGSAHSPTAVGDLVAFHDLNELLVGDFPRFTDRSIAGKMYILPEKKQRKEDRADKRLAGLLPNAVRDAFVTVRAVLAEPPTELLSFFAMVDQTDPIIAVWRYLEDFRGQLDVERFVAAMSDFFTNPSVMDACAHPLIRCLVTALQDRKLAASYASGSLSLRMIAEGARLPHLFLSRLIEHRSMHYLPVGVGSRPDALPC